MPDEIDRILDRALAGYSEVEAPVGLERRVLNRIRGERRRRGWRWVWIAATAAAAGLVVIGVVREERPVAKKEQASLTLARQATKGDDLPHRKIVRRRRVRAPRPLPLTAEERALVALVEQHPEAVGGMAKSGDDVEIPEIEIQPLESEDEEP